MFVHFVTAFIFSILAAMTVFSWMYQAKSAGFVGSLPLRREGMFLSCALAGFAMLTLPGVLAAVLTCAAAAGSCGFAAALGLAGEWLGKFLLLSLCYFGFACLCAQLTGALWVLPTVFCLLNVAVAAFWVLISNVLSLLLSGYDGGMPMLAADLSPLVRIFLFEWAETVSGTGAASRPTPSSAWSAPSWPCSWRKGGVWRPPRTPWP